MYATILFLLTKLMCLIFISNNNTNLYKGRYWLETRQVA